MKLITTTWRPVDAPNLHHANRIQWPRLCQIATAKLVLYHRQVHAIDHGCQSPGMTFSMFLYSVPFQWDTRDISLKWRRLVPRVMAQNLRSISTAPPLTHFVAQLTMWYLNTPP